MSQQSRHAADEKYRLANGALREARELYDKASKEYITAACAIHSRRQSSATT